MKVYKANKGKKKISALAICLLLTVVMAIGGTLAYLFTSTSPVENTFAPAKVGNYVKETLAEDEGKWEIQNVTIVNNIGGQTGNPEIVDAYIRAIVVANWRHLTIKSCLQYGVLITASLLPMALAGYRTQLTNIITTQK